MLSQVGRLLPMPFTGLLPPFDVQRVAEAIVQKPFPFLDNPLFTAIAFAPRIWERNTTTVDDSSDGDIRVGVERGLEIRLGYRFYRSSATGDRHRPVFVHFGRNTHLAADCDEFAPLLRRRVHAHLLAVDYRGYGWSTGRPLLSALTTDTDAIMAELPRILEEQGLAGAPLYLYGAALGSQCTIYLAHKYPTRFQGMVIEAGMIHQLHLPYVRTFAALFPGGQAIADALPDIYENEEKLRNCDVPLLVMHGNNDDTVPEGQGRDIVEASIATRKRFFSVENGGHDDLLSLHGDTMMTEVARFVNDTLGEDRTVAVSVEPRPDESGAGPRTATPEARGRSPSAAEEAQGCSSATSTVAARSVAKKRMPKCERRGGASPSQGEGRKRTGDVPEVGLTDTKRLKSS